MNDMPGRPAESNAWRQAPFAADVWVGELGTSPRASYPRRPETHAALPNLCRAQRLQSTAGGSSTPFARRRSCSVMRRPLPPITAMPAIVHASGKLPNSTHPISVAKTSCM